MLFGNTIIIRLRVFCGTLFHEPQSYPRPARYHAPRCHEQPIAPIDGHYLLATLHCIHDVRSHMLRRELQWEMAASNQVRSHEARTYVGDADWQATHIGELRQTLEVVRQRFVAE